jgi:hypothetical protein
MRLTFVCPAAYVEAANDLAMVLGYSDADALTYEKPSWVDASGNLYSCASTLVFGAFVSNALSPLVRPAWDVFPYKIDMDAATSMQSRIVLADFTPDADGNVPVYTASPDTILALPGDEPRSLLSAAGLTRIPSVE